MPGFLGLRERASNPQALTASSGSLTSGSAVALPNAVDCRSGAVASAGVVALPADFAAMFELLVQWGTVSGITQGRIAGHLFLVPALDGTNFCDVDLTAGAAYIPDTFRVGMFEVPRVPTAATNMRLATRVAELGPFLYRAYLLNGSGQAMTAGWTLTVASLQGGYT